MKTVRCDKCLTDIEVARFAGRIVLRHSGRVTYPTPQYGGTCPICGNTIKWEKIKQVAEELP